MLAFVSPSTPRGKHRADPSLCGGLTPCLCGAWGLCDPGLCVLASSDRECFNG